MTPAGAEGVLGMGSWNGKTSPGRQGLLRCPRGEPEEGTRSLGQRRLLGRPGDPHQRGEGAGPGPQGDPRLRGQHTTHKTIIGDIRFSGSENVGTPGTVGQVAERRVRGGVAAEGGDRQTESRPNPPGSRAPPPRRACGASPPSRGQRVRPGKAGSATLLVSIPSRKYVLLRLARTHRLRPHHRGHLRARRARAEPAVRADCASSTSRTASS